MISDNRSKVQIATVSNLGVVKPDGTTVTVDADGTIHGASTYVLPTASTTTLGGVKIDGTTVTITDDGVISAAGGSTSTYSTTETAVGKWIDNKTVYRKVIQAAADASISIDSSTAIDQTIMRSDGIIDTSSGYKLFQYQIPQDVDMTISVAVTKTATDTPAVLVADDSRKLLAYQVGGTGTYTISTATYSNKIKYLFVNSDDSATPSVQLVGVSDGTISDVDTIINDYSYFSHAVDLTSGTLSAIFHNYIILEYTKTTD